MNNRNCNVLAHSSFNNGESGPQNSNGPAHDQKRWIQHFYHDQQRLNQEAIAGFNELNDRACDLENRADKAEKFMKKQKKINVKTAVSLETMDNRLKAVEKHK